MWDWLPRVGARQAARSRPVRSLICSGRFIDGTRCRGRRKWPELHGSRASIQASNLPIDPQFVINRCKRPSRDRRSSLVCTPTMSRNCFRSSTRFRQCRAEASRSKGHRNRHRRRFRWLRTPNDTAVRCANVDIRPVIAKRRTGHGSGLGTYRWVVERTHSWLQNFRRLCIRFDRCADIHEAFLKLGCSLVFLNIFRRAVLNSILNWSLHPPAKPGDYLNFVA